VLLHFQNIEQEAAMPKCKGKGRKTGKSGKKY